MIEKQTRFGLCHPIMHKPGFADVLAATALSLAALLASSEARAQSFSCATAENPSELAICNSENLLVLDEKLDGMIAQRLATAKNKPAQQLLSRAHDEWLLLRNECGTDQPCLELRYSARIADLAGTSPVASFVRFAVRQPKG